MRPDRASRRCVATSARGTRRHQRWRPLRRPPRASQLPQPPLPRAAEHVPEQLRAVRLAVRERPRRTRCAAAPLASLPRRPRALLQPARPRECSSLLHICPPGRPLQSLTPSPAFPSLLQPCSFRCSSPGSTTSTSTATCPATTAPHPHWPAWPQARCTSPVRAADLAAPHIAPQPPLTRCAAPRREPADCSPGQRRRRRRCCRLQRVRTLHPVPAQPHFLGRAAPREALPRGCIAARVVCRTPEAHGAHARAQELPCRKQPGPRGPATLGP